MEVREFYQPRSVQEALELLGRAPGETRVVAGGTDLFLQLRRGDIRAAYLLDVGGVAELAYIREEPQFIRVGAATLVDDLARSGLLRRYAAALAEAASALGSPQIRNRATIGGNLGRSSPAADCVCALMALGAEVLVQSASGTREIPIDRFLLGPGKNALAPDELIVEVRMGKPRGRFGSRFLKLGRRKALVLATASAAAHGLVAGGDPGRGRRGRPGGLADLGRAGFGRIPADGDPRPGQAGARRRLGSGAGGLTRRAV